MSDWLWTALCVQEVLQAALEELRQQAPLDMLPAICLPACETVGHNLTMYRQGK